MEVINLLCQLLRSFITICDQVQQMLPNILANIFKTSSHGLGLNHVGTKWSHLSPTVTVVTHFTLYMAAVKNNKYTLIQISSCNFFENYVMRVFQMPA